MYRGIGAAVAGVIVAMVIMAGCGSSDSDSLTKAEFVKQSDVICKKAVEEKNASIESAFAREASQQPKKESEQELQERLIVEVALPPIRGMEEELGDLGAPSGEEEQVESIVAAFDTALNKAEANPNLALTRAVNLFNQPNKLARAYGLKDCAEI